MFLFVKQEKDYNRFQHVLYAHSHPFGDLRSSTRAQGTTCIVFTSEMIVLSRAARLAPGFCCPRCLLTKAWENRNKSGGLIQISSSWAALIPPVVMPAVFEQLCFISAAHTLSRSSDRKPSLRVTAAGSALRGCAGTDRSKDLPRQTGTHAN